MQVRTQLIVVGLLAIGWVGSQFAHVSPLTHQSSDQREILARLESRVETHRDDVAAARELSARYFRLGLMNLLLDKMATMTPQVRRDPRVSLFMALAYEHRGELNAASMNVNSALNRCTELLADPVSYQEAGCENQGQLVLESETIDRMIHDGVDPARDPDRANEIRAMVRRPITIGPF